MKFVAIQKNLSRRRGCRPFVPLGDRVENRFDLKRSQVRARFQHERDNPGNVRTGETVAGQLTIATARPGRLDLHPRRYQLNDSPVLITEIKRLTARPLYNYYQCRRQNALR